MGGLVLAWVVLPGLCMRMSRSVENTHQAVTLCTQLFCDLRLSQNKVRCLKLLGFNYYFENMCGLKIHEIRKKHSLFLKNLRGPEGRNNLKYIILKQNKGPYAGHSSLETTYRENV